MPRSDLFSRYPDDNALGHCFLAASCYECVPASRKKLTYRMEFLCLGWDRRGKPLPACELQMIPVSSRVAALRLRLVGKQSYQCRNSAMLPLHPQANHRHEDETTEGAFRATDPTLDTVLEPYCVPVSPTTAF